MGVKRIVDIDFWNDDKVVELFSPEDKLFMLYLMTNPHTTQLGIYAINKKIMAFELGYSIDTISVLLERFENKYNMIKYSNETNEVAIKNYLKYSIIKGGKPVEDCLEKEIKQVKNKELLKYVFKNLNGCESLNTTIYALIDKYSDIYDINDNDDEKDNDNDNDNENDVSCTYRERIGEEELEKISNEYENIKNEMLNQKDDNTQVCEWCGINTSVLHKHHYPIPKRYGGKDVVNICSNCHNEFHNLESKENNGVLVIDNLVINKKNKQQEENDTCKTIIDYLNFKTKKNYKYTPNNLSKIKARLKENFTIDDFKEVIDKKCMDWLNDKDMNKYLRPETLFGNKFESYLQQDTKQITTRDLEQYMDFSDFRR